MAQLSNQNETISKVETFIRQLENREIVIDPSARTIPFTRLVDGLHTNLAELLYEGIENYRIMKNEPGVRYTFANLCLTNINRAYAYGVIKETTGLSAKIEVLARINVQLTNENEITKRKLTQLSSDYLKLQGRYDELNEKLNRTFKNQAGV